MRAIIKLSILITSLLSPAFLIADVKPVERAEWFGCEKDEDCADINYSCAGATVNKKFIKEANLYYQQQNAVRNCVTKPSPELDAIPFKVFCKDKKCTKQGRNPKQGFS